MVSSSSSARPRPYEVAENEVLTGQVWHQAIQLSSKSQTYRNGYGSSDQAMSNPRSSQKIGLLFTSQHRWVWIKSDQSRTCNFFATFWTFHGNVRMFHVSQRHQDHPDGFTMAGDLAWSGASSRLLLGRGLHFSVDSGVAESGAAWAGRL